MDGQITNQKMTISQFSLLSEDVQMAYVYNQGHYVARRWDEVPQAVLLYQLPDGFFVELNYDVDQNEVTFLFPLAPGGPDDRIADYAMFVKLPDDL